MNDLMQSFEHYMIMVYILSKKKKKMKWLRLLWVIWVMLNIHTLEH